MANFPTSLDTLTNPTSGNTLDSPSHSVQHSDANDILEALEAKVGIGTATAGSATAGHALVASTGGTTTWTSIGTAGITSGTATNGQVLTANGSGAVTFNTPSQGLTLINTTTFTAQSSVSLPASTFTATYKNYRMIFRATQNTSTGALSMRLRAAGTDLVTGYTNGGIETGVSNNNTRIGSFGNTSWVTVQCTAGNLFALILDLTLPQVANQTLGFYNAFSTSAGDNKIVAVQIGDSNSYDSMTFITSGGTFTGTVEAYGYNV
jgi:hypothetical protein